MTGGSRTHTRAFVAGLVLLALLVVTDVLLGPNIAISGSYAVPAVLVAAAGSVQRTALVAGCAVALSALSGLWNDNFGTPDWRVRLLLSAALGGLAIVSAAIRVSRESDLQRMTVIAETAQRAVLRVMPSAVGSVGFAARYVSATREALVGGDLYEVAESAYGVRVIVGDVKGKGLEAVQLAATVLGGFRRAALTQPSLAAVAADLDAVVSAVASDEDFVTALLAEFHDDHTVTLVNCGHHPPVLVTDTPEASMLDAGEPVPPLGLGPTPRESTSGWPEGSRMLIYTDGLVEARDKSGGFFPLDEYALGLRQGSLEEALDRLLAGLKGHAGPEVKDDMALVLVEHRGS